MLGSQAYVENKFRDKMDAFIFGAVTGNLGLCTALVSAADATPWGEDADLDIGGRKGGRLLSCDHMPYTYQCALPPQFLFALSRAAVSTTLGTKEYGKRFEVILKAALAAKGEYQAGCP